MNKQVILKWLGSVNRQRLRLRSKFIQLRYNQVLRKIKSKKAPIKVVFFVTQPQLWSADSLCRHFRDDSRFTFEAIAFPNHEAGTSGMESTCHKTYDFFDKKNIPVRIGFDGKKSVFIRFSEIDADIVFFDQPWMGLPGDLSYPAISKKALICYIPYGFEVSPLKTWCFGTDFHNCAWRIFSQTHWHKTQFRNYGSVGGTNVVVTGYPKFDDYDLPLSANSYRYWKRGNAAKKRVIWAPHWSFGSDNVLNYGTFDIYAKALLALATQNSAIDWLVKPHQRLVYELINKKIMTSQEVDAYFKEWQDLLNGSLYESGSYIECFQTSDLLITDCGSFLPEYVPTGKPILHLVNPNSKGYNEFGKEIVRTLYTVRSTSELNNLFEDVIIYGNDHMNTKRSPVAHKTRLTVNAGYCIYRVLSETVCKHKAG